MTLTLADLAARLDTRYVTPAFYGHLLARSRELRDRSDAPQTELRPLAESLLYTEARLLDERRYEAWIALFTDDGINWVPGTPDAADPRTCTSLQFDDRRRLIDRIALERTGHLHAQTPPSRTSRSVTNVEVWPGDGDVLRVRSNLVIWEYRHGSTVPHAGWQDHTLARAGDAWAIRCRIVHLLDCDAPQGNVTYVI